MTHQEMLFNHVINIIHQITEKFTKITAQRYDESKTDQVGIIFTQPKGDEYTYDGVEFESKKFELRVTCENNQTDIFENWEFIENFVDIFENALSTVEGLEIDGVKHLGSKVVPLYTNAYGLQELKCIIEMQVEFNG